MSTYIFTMGYEGKIKEFDTLLVKFTDDFEKLNDITAIARVETGSAKYRLMVLFLFEKDIHMYRINDEYGDIYFENENLK